MRPAQSTNQKRISLEELLTEALEDLHHNATLHGKLLVSSDFETDLFERHFEAEKEHAFEELPKLFPWLHSTFGDFYQYGRGGRTVMPGRLARSHNSSEAIRVGDMPSSLDALDLRRLLKELRSFNAHVRAWCKSAPDFCLEYIREEYAEELKAHEGKKRKVRRVVSYE